MKVDWTIISLNHFLLEWLGEFAYLWAYSDEHWILCFFHFRVGLERVLCITSWCTENTPGNPKLFEWFLKPLFLNGFLIDMAAMERLLINSSLNYTIVRPPELTSSELQLLDLSVYTSYTFCCLLWEPTSCQSQVSWEPLYILLCHSANFSIHGGKN